MVDLLNGGLQNWVITTNGPVGSFSGTMGIINSTTAANGFALFDSDALNTQYTPQEATLTYNGTIDCSAYQYINRLSDFFFIAARWAQHFEGEKELIYVQPASMVKSSRLN